MKFLKRCIVFLVLLAVVVAICLVGLSYGKPSLSFGKEKKAGARNLTILTWNTARMNANKKPLQNEVLRFLMMQDADVVCLQEVDVYKDARYLTLPDVKQILGARYPYSYIDFSIYNSRHQFGTMVWSRYPLIHKQSIRYESRANLSNRCDVVVGVDTFRLINNHLESYSFSPSDLAEMESRRDYEGLRSSAKRMEKKWERALPVRNAQARLIREEIKQSPYPVIVVGDFNSIPLSYVYFTISRGLHDAWSETHWGQLGATCVKKNVGVRIDYILSSDPLVPTECHIPEATGSDHLPVVATLTW